MSSFGFSVRLWLAAGCVGLWACSSAPPTAQVRTDGRLRVLPQEFTGEAGCSFASGDDSELGYYVATLVDLGLAPGTADETDVDTTDYPRVSGSGTVARCTSSTTFATRSNDTQLQINHLYAAIIDGYPPAAPPELGRDRAGGDWPAPRWQWLCSFGGLDEVELRWLMDQVNELPRGATPPTTTPRDAGGLGNSGTWDNSETDTAIITQADGSVVNEDDVVTTGIDTATPLDLMTESSDAGVSSWSQVLRAAALEGAAPPAQVVSGGQAGVRGCLLLE